MRPTVLGVAGKMQLLAILICARHLARAACWVDASVSHVAQQIATASFRATAGRMPAIAVCHAGDFAQGIGGDYTPGVHRIRIPEWQVVTANLHTVLAHELAHAEVWLTGRDPGADGHGRGFFEVLLGAGYGNEAERVAAYVANGHSALADAKAFIRPIAPPNPPIAAGPNANPRQGRVATYCEWVPVRFLVPLPGGHMLIQTQWHQQCRQIWNQ